MLDRLMSVTLVGCAIAITSSVVYRSMLVGGGSVADRQPEFIPFWEDALAHAIPIGGDVDATVTVLVLSDLECPACGRFHTRLEEILHEWQEDVQALYVPYPLSYHRFALPAARAAECAHQVSAFRPWIDVVYRKQDSLGLKSWGSFAVDAGIADTAWVHSCATNAAPVSRIDAGLGFASRLESAGTPTVIVNGWRLPGTPSSVDLDAAITAILEGQEPQ